MESETFAPAKDFLKCCNCGCDCSLVSGSSGTWIRSVKRKYEEFEEGNRFFIPGFDLFSNARVQVENECVALRETLSSQQQAIQDLHTELEEERNASSSAANEAMSMILRLQREKAEIQMEARQFKRFAEEKMAHDQQELGALEDLLYKREQAIQSLTCEVQAYKHRMMSYGLTEAEADGEKGCFSRNTSMVDIDAQFDLPAFDYPPLRCNLNENPGALEGDIGVADIEKYAAGESPHCRELKNLEHRISQMERNPSYNQLDGDFSAGKNVLEKVIVGHSPRWPRHYRKLSTDSSGSFLGMAKESNPEYAVESPKFNGNSRRMEHVSQTEDSSHLKRMDNASEIGDDTSDRVYTIDSVYNGVSYNGVAEGKSGAGVHDEYVVTPRDSLTRPDFDDPDIKKLYMRLQALEADRESMRQAIISMRTDKAQLVLLKEIAQHLSKEMVPESRMPVQKASLLGGFSFLSIVKWVVSFVFWRKKARRSKYTYGLSMNNMGLLMLLDKGPRRQWRCLTSTQV